MPTVVGDDGLAVYGRHETRGVRAAIACLFLAATPAPAAQAARFTVSFAGHGSYRTDYHATPPNPGGRADV